MSVEAAARAVVSESVARLLAALGREDALLAPALARLDWVAALPNAAAPGFVYLAGACAGRAVGGGGRDLREAAGKLAGETSEILASLGAGGVAPAPEGLAADPRLAAVWGAGPSVAAARLGGGGSAAVPAAAIFRDLAAGPGAPPRSLGAGAGPSAAAARLAGLLELVERDAAAAWWGGETRARAAAAEVAAPAAALLAGLRDGAPGPGRRTAFLMLPSPTGLPVAAAVSRDGSGSGGSGSGGSGAGAPGAGGLVVGLKAALDPGAALAGAALELLQMEIGLEIARLRAGQGRAAAEDAAVLARAGLDVDAFAAFAALPPAGEEASADGLDAVAARLAGLGIAALAVDLPGLAGGLAVAKVFAPGLRPMPGPGPAARAGSPGSAAELI